MKRKPINQTADVCENFLRNYGKKVSPQEAKQALNDSQIKNMSLSISSLVKSSDKGTILDIGCGKGIIMNRLAKIDSFKKKKDWIYFGVEAIELFDEKLS